MKSFLCLLCFLLPFVSRSDDRKSRRSEPTVLSTMMNVRAQCDSVLAEADRLYWYESAAWITGDMAAERDLLSRSEGYLSYGEADSTYSIVYSADSVLLTAYFGRDSSLCDTVVRAFRPEEIRLRDMRRKLIDSVYGGAISIYFYEGYDPNFVLTEHDGGYKLFLMMGTQLRGVIPFGNDYIFFADSMGTITHWRQLHRSLLSADFGKKEIRKQFLAGKVRAVIHNHLNSEPLITATDICLMRMYGPLLGVDTLIVVSPSLKTRFVYSVQDNAVGMFTIDDN